MNTCGKKLDLPVWVLTDTWQIPCDYKKTCNMLHDEMHTMDGYIEAGGSAYVTSKGVEKGEPLT